MVSEVWQSQHRRLFRYQRRLELAENLALEWKRFKGQWKNYTKAAEIDREDEDRQAAIFLACIGGEAYEIFTTLEFDDDGDRDKKA